MYQVLTVEVYCEDCLLGAKDDKSLEHFEMQVEGSLFFNPNTRTQSQHYKCPSCNKEISIVINQPL